MFNKIKLILDLLKLIESEGIELPANVMIKRKGSQLALTLNIQLPTEIELTLSEVKNTEEK